MTPSLWSRHTPYGDISFHTLLTGSAPRFWCVLSFDGSLAPAHAQKHLLGDEGTAISIAKASLRRSSYRHAPPPCHFLCLQQSMSNSCVPLTMFHIPPFRTITLTPLGPAMGPYANYSRLTWNHEAYRCRVPRQPVDMVCMKFRFHCSFATSSFLTTICGPAVICAIFSSCAPGEQYLRGAL